MPKANPLNMCTMCTTTTEFEEATKELAPASIVDLKLVDGGVLKDVDNMKGVYNHGLGQLAASVAPHYNLVTHREYFKGFKEALDSMNIPHTSTIRQFGNTAYVDFDFKGKNLEMKDVGEEFTTGFRLTNSYDKTTGISISARFVRLACTNGMVVRGDATKFVLKHSDKMAKDIKSWLEARLIELVNVNNDLARWVSECMKDSIEWKNAARVLEKLLNNNKHMEEILKLLEIDVIWQKKTATEKKRPTFMTERAEGTKITRWEMYNAITAYATHNTRVTPFIEQAMQKKAQRILKTPLEHLPLAEVPVGN